MNAALLLLACAAGPSDTAEPAPTLVWLAPEDGAALPAGELGATVLLEGASLVSPAKHNTGAPIGYLVVSVDGEEVLRVGATTFALALDPGDHALTVALQYADGDPVLVIDDALCEEEWPDCAPLATTVHVTVR